MSFKVSWCSTLSSNVKFIWQCIFCCSGSKLSTQPSYHNIQFWTQIPSTGTSWKLILGIPVLRFRFRVHNGCDWEAFNLARQEGTSTVTRLSGENSKLDIQPTHAIYLDQQKAVCRCLPWDLHVNIISQHILLQYCDIFLKNTAYFRRKSFYIEWHFVCSQWVVYVNHVLHKFVLTAFLGVCFAFQEEVIVLLAKIGQVGWLK